MVRTPHGSSACKVQRLKTRMPDDYLRNDVAKLKKRYASLGAVRKLLELAKAEGGGALTKPAGSCAHPRDGARDFEAQAPGRVVLSCRAQK